MFRRKRRQQAHTTRVLDRLRAVTGPNHLEGSERTIVQARLMRLNYGHRARS